MKLYAIILCLIFLCACTPIDKGCSSIETIKQLEPHQNIRFLLNIDGKLAYGSEDNITCTGQYRKTVCTADITVYINEEITAVHDGGIHSAWEMNNKLAYKIREGDNLSLFVDNKKIGSHIMLGSANEVNGKIVYEASNDMQCSNQKCSGKILLVEDGVEIETDYKSILFISEIAGKLAYAGTKDDQEIYIIHGDKKYGPYKEIKGPIEIEGKIAFIANNQLIIDGEPMKLDDTYYHLNHLNYVNGKIIYSATNGEGTYLFVGEEKLGPYELISGDLKVIGDKIAMNERKDGNKYNLIWDGNKYGPYKSEPQIYNLYGKLAYVVRNYENYRPLNYTLYYDGCEITHDHIGKLIEYNGNIVDATKENDQDFIRIQKISK